MSKTLRTLTSTTTLDGGALMAVRLAGETVDKAILFSDFMLNAADRRIRAVDKGAKFDALEVGACTITNGVATISSTRISFDSRDHGKIMVIKSTPTSATYVASGGSTLKFTIMSTSGGVATLNANVTSTSATAVCYFGTDDTVAMQSAIDAVNPLDAARGATGTWTYESAGVVECPVGMALITKELKIRPGMMIQGQGPLVTTLKWASGNTMAATDYFGIMNGGEANGSTRIYYNTQFRDIKFDATAAFTTAYSYHAKCVEMIYGVRPVVVNCWFEGSPGTAWGCDYISGALVYGNRFENCGRLWAPGGGGGSGLDFQTAIDNFTPQNTLIGMDSRIVSNNIFINCAVSAVRNTNNATGYQTSNDIITHNLVKSNLATGKGIEDNSNLGAIIANNAIIHSGTAQSTEGPIGTEGQHIWCAIITTGGRGGIIANNTIHGGWYDGIRLNRFQKSGSSITPQDYLVTGNNISGCTRNGIRVDINSTYEMKNVGITNNHVALSGAAGVAISNSGTGGEVKFLNLSDNTIYDSGQLTSTDEHKSGIYINTILTGAKMNNNYLYDSGTAKQKYGITIDGVAVTNTMASINHASLNTTSALNTINGGTIAGKGTGNLGFADF